MAETTETATNPTEANTASEASATTLLTGKEGDGTQQQQGDTQQTQQTAEGETKPATEEKPAETKPEGAPEKYEFAAPEGKEYDSTLLDSYSEAAKEANLTQDAAQKLLDKVAPALANRQEEQVKAIQTQWSESAKADKEFGGEKLQENLAIAKKAVDQFGTPELNALLKNGLGNNPEVIRFMYRIGKAISEDTFVSGNPNHKGSVSAASVLYDNTKKEQ